MCKSDSALNDMKPKLNHHKDNEYNELMMAKTDRSNATLNLDLTTLYLHRAECKETRIGETYAGTLSTTLHGWKCQNWYHQYPFKHDIGIRKEEFPDDSVEAAMNYCRNPNNYTYGPWCFTTNPGVLFDYV